MSFSKVFLGNSACFFRGVWEKHRESDVSKFCKIPRASIKRTSGDANPNCLTHSPSRHSFWDKNFFRFTSISLASKLIIYGRIRFSSAHVVRTVGHIKVFIIFLVFTFATFSINSWSYFVSQSRNISAIVSKLESVSFQLV